MPLVRGGEWRFLIVVYRSEPHDWREDEIELIRELTNRIWTRLERERAEEALAASEGKYRWLFETMDLGFALHEAIRDENGQLINYRLLELNPAFERLTGMDISKAVGKTILEVFPGHDPWWFTTFQQLLESKETVHIEQFLPQVNRWYDITAFYYREEQFAAYYSDITERKRTEANLAFLAEVSRDLVHLKTIDETMNTLGAKIGRHFTATRCAFLEFNEAMDGAVCNYDWHQDNEPSLVGSYRIADFYTDEFLQIMRAGEAFVVTDREADSRADARNLAALNIASCIVIPIITGRELLFVLSINDSQTRNWRDDEIELMTELTTRIWARLERARAEEALRESEKRLRLAVEATRMGTWEWNLLTDEVYWNEQHFRLFGLEPSGSPSDPISSDLFFRHLHPDDRERVTALLQKAIAEQTIYETEFRAVLDDGSERWMSEYGRVVETIDGKPVRMSGVVFDVTKRRETEQPLRRSDERFRTLVQNLPDYAIFRIDPVGMISEWTEGAQRVKGYTADEVVGQSIALFYTPEGLAAGELRDEMAEAARSGRAERESVRIRKGGQRFWVDEIMTAIRDEAGRLVGFTKISRDITRRKKADEVLFDSRQRLQIVLDSIADHAIITIDLKSQIVSWNSGAEQMFGHTADEAIGQSAAIFFTPDDRAAGQLEKEMNMARREGRAPDDRYHLRKDGSQLYVLGVMAPLYDADNTLLGYVEVARDQTDRRQMEQALREADRRKDEFLALLAHELRNPLATLNNTLLILQLTGGTNDGFELPTAVDLMIREVAHLVKLVDDLLDVSRISRGKIVLTRKRIDLMLVVRETVEGVASGFRAANRTLTVDLLTESLYLSGDATRLKQVVSNLLSNALKFTASGGHVWVSLDATDQESGKPMAILRVRDDGIGIPTHERERIFQMFVQVDSSLGRTHDGLGLGLTLVSELVGLHDGRVEVHSAGEGQGSEFVVYLPVES